MHCSKFSSRSSPVSLAKITWGSCPTRRCLVHIYHKKSKKQTLCCNLNVGKLLVCLYDFVVYTGRDFFFVPSMFKQVRQASASYTSCVWGRLLVKCMRNFLWSVWGNMIKDCIPTLLDENNAFSYWWFYEIALWMYYCLSLFLLDSSLYSSFASR